MDDRLHRVEDKIDKLSDRLASIDATLASQHVSLKEHIRRTAILEKQMKPLERHVAQVSGIMKGLGILAALGAAIEGVVVFLQYLRNIH